jgi:hypothetical protein
MFASTTPSYKRTTANKAPRKKSDKIMIAKEIRNYLDKVNPEALFIGTGEEHDSAIIGAVYIERDGKFVHVAMYEYEELILSFAKEFEDDEDPEQTAMEWVDFNVVGAYMGINTPYIVYK